MIRLLLAEALKGILARLIQEGALPSGEYPEPSFQEPKQPEHGDLATSFALAAAKSAGKNPRELALLLVEELSKEESVASAESAGPGFVNLRLNPAWVARQLSLACASQGKDVRRDSSHYARVTAAKPLKINVEHVSVNPNGPITIGSGRGAAFGSALCSILEAAGHQVHREYYINDGVNSEQMRLFAESVRSYACGLPFPEKGYKGDYVQDVAARLGEAAPAQNASITEWQQVSQDIMLAKQREDLAAFRTLFDTWFSEQSLHDGGLVQQQIEKLAEAGVADERPIRRKIVRAKDEKGRMTETLEEEEQPVDEDDAAGAGATLWLRSTEYGDDQDRVLRRKDGRLTYIASDVAYHRDKFNRPPSGDKLITILGPDHHGYIGRLRAVVAAMIQSEEELTPEAALEAARQRLDVLIFQLVRFVKDGKPAPMRKRDGNIYAIIDLIREIGEKVKPGASLEEQLGAGADVARFFYLNRSHESAFDFDLDLAQRQSDDNPVFYVQYAHARICSVLDRAAEAGIVASPEFAFGRLEHPREMAVMLKTLDLPFEISRIAEDYAVHRLATYAIELARLYHHFYDACRVVLPEDMELAQARASLSLAVKVALATSLELLGISAPTRMERSAQEPVP